MTFVEWTLPPGKKEKEEIRKVYVNISDKRRPNGLWIFSSGLFVGDKFDEKDQITEFGGPGVSISLYDPEIKFDYDPKEEIRSYYFLATLKRVRKRKISRANEAFAKEFIKKVLNPMKGNLKFVLKFDPDTRMALMPNTHRFGQFVNNQKEKANAEIVCTIKPDDSLFDMGDIGITARNAFVAMSKRLSMTDPSLCSGNHFIGWMNSISRYVKIYLAAKRSIEPGSEIFIAQEKHSKTKPSEFVYQPDDLRSDKSFVLEDIIY